MPLSEKQLEVRRKGFGASEIASIVGLNHWKSRSALILEKQGKVDSEFSGNAATERGEYLEPVLGKWYQDKTGNEVIPAGGETLVHPEHSWMLATPDFVRADGAGLVECKTANARQRFLWGHTSLEDPSDIIPQQYIVQCHAQAEVWGKLEGKRVSTVPVVAFVDATFRLYEIPIDQAIIDALLEAGEKAWSEVESGQDPGPDSSTTYAEYLRQRWDKNTEDLLISTAEIDRAAHELKLAREQVKHWKERESELKAKVQAAIQDKAGVEGDWGKIYWKFSKSSMYFAHKEAMQHLEKEHPDIYEHIRQDFTRYRPGTRAFRCYFKKEDKANEGR